MVHADVRSELLLLLGAFNHGVQISGITIRDTDPVIVLGLLGIRSGSCGNNAGLANMEDSLVSRSYKSTSSLTLMQSWT